VKPGTAQGDDAEFAIVQVQTKVRAAAQVGLEIPLLDIRGLRRGLAGATAANSKQTARSRNTSFLVPPQPNNTQETAQSSHFLADLPAAEPV